MRTGFFSCVFWVMASLASAQTYDVVILNGRVMDPETNFDAVTNVGISGGWIAEITDQPIEGDETIDATGHIVSPGFIDTQHHGHGNLFGVRLSLRDGVTTPMDLEYGNINSAEWYAEREGKWPVNFAAAASHELQRMRVLDGLVFEEGFDAEGGLLARGDSYNENGIPDWAETVPTIDQLNDIMAGIDEELRAGALTAASTMGYMAVGATTLEVFNLQKAAANYDRPSSFHVRLLGNNAPPYEGNLGNLEQMANAAALGAPMLISHNNNVGWWEIEERAQGMREQGMNVWSEYYPYTCGSTTIGSEFLKPEGLALLGWGYDQMLNPRTGEFMSEEEYQKIVAEDPAFVIIACIPEREEWLPLWLRVPHMTVAGDQMPPTDENGRILTGEDPFEAYVGHPRTAGSHAATLRLARENGVPWMQMIASNSYWAAKHLGDTGLRAMQVRGRMQEGMVADITIFDPETVTDNATYQTGFNGLPSTGIPYVLVNGAIVVSNSELVDGVLAGQPIRYPVEDKGRWVPLEKTSYLDNLLGGEIPGAVQDYGTDPEELRGQSGGEDDARLNAPQETKPTRTASADWFKTYPSENELGVVMCPIHGVLEDRRLVQREWSGRMMTAANYDPLAN
ncbi:amidohydrolase family protein [Ruegeria sp. Alg231-54]|uniref:amidohydrolase family protein n=1 Tax=Ruegeria sp. Alg231-54 TaxID=1922221 RepID=UPI000D54C276|nr:amidohydrolase family protein [Ruegeria sp. Alg231-54]